jgi:hypothetical protein
MDDEVKILSVYIGQKDIYEWLKGDGKSILMPELLSGCEKVVVDEIEEIQVLRVESLVRGQQKAFDFFARKWEVEDTLDKIMEWALSEEEYEICERVKILRDYLQYNPFKKKTTLI